MYVFPKMQRNDKETFFKIFDSKIQSVLLYSSEIWGLHILDSIERVHLMACKRYLGVPSRTPNKMVYGELGRYPLFIASHVRCIKYWFRLLYMEQSRLPNQAYRMLVNLDERNSVGQRRYENSCVKLAFTLYGYSKALETSNHFCMSSSKDC